MEHLSTTPVGSLNSFGVDILRHQRKLWWPRHFNTYSIQWFIHMGRFVWWGRQRFSRRSRIACWPSCIMRHTAHGSDWLLAFLPLPRDWLLRLIAGVEHVDLWYIGRGGRGGIQYSWFPSSLAFLLLCDAEMLSLQSFILTRWRLSIWVTLRIVLHLRKAIRWGFERGRRERECDYWSSAMVIWKHTLTH